MMETVEERTLRVLRCYAIKVGSCWLWNGLPRQKDGYGNKRVSGKTILAHRFVYELLKGKIPNDKILHHNTTCISKLCVNPEHLEVTTRFLHPDSGGTINRNKTHCKFGHEFSKENTGYITWKGRTTRYCKICNSHKGRLMNRILKQVKGIR